MERLIRIFASGLLLVLFFIGVLSVYSEIVYKDTMGGLFYTFIAAITWLLFRFTIDDEVWNNDKPKEESEDLTANIKFVKRNKDYQSTHPNSLINEKFDFTDPSILSSQLCFHLGDLYRKHRVSIKKDYAYKSEDLSFHISILINDNVRLIINSNPIVIDTSNYFLHVRIANPKIGNLKSYNEFIAKDISEFVFFSYKHIKL